MKKKKIEIKDENYPFLLKQIDNPPKKIYVYGNDIDLNQKMVTVIGTSTPTLKGKIETAKLVKKLIKNGYCIATSISKGIDEIVYRTTLENNGKIIIIIPWDVNDIRNQRNRGKFKYIMENNGNIITEFDSSEGIISKNYIELNRVLCGLSKSLIIVEAGIASRTMITVGYALEQNRDIYVIIGDLKRAKKSGTNSLIKEGAKPIISVGL